MLKTCRQHRWTLIVLGVVATGDAGAQTSEQEPTVESHTPAATTTTPPLPDLPDEYVDLQQGKTLDLSFGQAVELGIQRNVRTTVSRQAIVTAEGERLRSLSGLLPNVSASVGQTRQTANLMAVGIDPEAVPIINTSVFGPFNHFDARIYAMQTIFDLTAIGAAQAGKASLDRAEVKYRLSTHLVFERVGETYVEVLGAQAAISMFEADLALAEELLKDTKAAYDTGVATALDDARAEARVYASQTRLLEAKNQLAVAQNKLKALLLIPQADDLSLTTELTDRDANAPKVEDAVRSAETNRPDLEFSMETVRIAGFKHRAAIGQQVPSIGFGANYGGSGSKPNEAVQGTYTIGGVLSVPLFDGGNTAGNIKATKSRLHEAEQILRQLKEDADENVRSALATIEYSSQEIVAARERMKVAELTVKLSKDRFFSGVNDNLEVVAAQTSLSTARNLYVRALAKYNVARIKLAVALGVIQGFQL